MADDPEATGRAWLEQLRAEMKAISAVRDRGLVAVTRRPAPEAGCVDLSGSTGLEPVPLATYYRRVTRPSPCPGCVAEKPASRDVLWPGDEPDELEIHWHRR